MTLKTNMLTDLGAVFYDTDEFADTVSYTPAGGGVVTVTIIPEEQDPSIMADAPPGDDIRGVQSPAQGHVRDRRRDLVPAE